MNGSSSAPPHPSFAEAAGVWARIGLLSFGGPAGQIALMHRELVEERRWISEGRFLHALNYCMLLPGPEAQQLATYVGWLLHGTRGGVVAGTLFVLPGFAVILALSAAYALFHQTDWLNGVFFGLKAAVLAIVVEAVIRVGRRALKTRFAVALAALSFLAIFVFAVPLPLVVLAGGLAGYAAGRAAPRLLEAGRATVAASLPDPPAVIDAGTPDRPAERGRAFKVIAVWGLLWIAPLPPILAVWGWSGTYAAVFLFFSKMAAVTFGGAYAVLAYVAQEAVGRFGWIEPGEMLDGLALAETTPGPLVLVLTFIGFLAGFRDPGGLGPLWGGILGAALTTWATFVPCFLWIFLGAPYVERLRANAALSGALAAITAAVVGVILNLALWLGLHVLFAEVGSLDLGPASLPWPEWRSFDPAAGALALLAGFMLFRWRQGVLRTLGLCALLGLGLSALS